jgi:hypothetical protein
MNSMAALQGLDHGRCELEPLAAAISKRHGYKGATPHPTLANTWTFARHPVHHAILTDSVDTQGNMLGQVTFAHLQGSPDLFKFMTLALLRLMGVSCQPYS